MLFIIFELTGGIRNAWPDCHSFPSLELNLKYSTLHRIALKKSVSYLLYTVLMCTRIWPIFYSAWALEEKSHELVSTTLTLPFPTLIYGALSGKQDLKSDDDLLEVVEPYLKRSDS